MNNVDRKPYNITQKRSAVAFGTQKEVTVTIVKAFEL